MSALVATHAPKQIELLKRQENVLKGMQVDLIYVYVYVLGCV